MKPLTKHETAAIEQVAKLDDPAKLRALISNAKRQNSSSVYEAAFKELCLVLPSSNPGTVEHEFWQTIHAFEEILSEERGKTVRLSRTRQKIGRVGERKVLEDFARHSKATEGFEMLIARGLPEMTGEAIVLRFRHEFDEATVMAAQARLEGVGVKTSALFGREIANG